MADFSTLIASIEATIKQNGVQAITGQVLQDELLAMVAAINQLKQDTLEGYSFYGEALPNGATRVVTQNTFFLAGAGSYTINGNAVTITDSGISVIVYDCVNDEITTYQLFAYDANPTSGSANAVTSGGVHNALAGKQALVPAATEGNLAEFDNAGQVRDAGLATSDLATKDGHYPDLFAGFAGNLVDTRSAGTRQSFAFRQSGGDGVNYMKSIKGKTIAWNQLLPKNGMPTNTARGITFTNNGDGSITLNGTATGNAVDIYQFNFIAGHKYYIPVTNIEGVSFSANDESTWGAPATGVFTATTQNIMIVGVREGTTVNNVKVWPWFIDLTLLGLGDLTADQFRALHPLGYYNYNAGVLKNNAATGLETVGFNQWDEEAELGSLNTTTGEKVPNATMIRSKNYISVLPSTNYYVKGNLVVCFYDAEGTYIGFEGNANNTIITTPDGCYKILFRASSDYGTTYNHDICINLSDASRNGTYEPYWKREIVLGLGNLACHDENNNAVVVNGLDGVGNVYDEAVVENGMVTKIIKRFAEVDLGDLNWTSGGAGLFVASETQIPNILNSQDRAMICSAYAFSSAQTSSEMPDKSTGNNQWTTGHFVVLVKDSAYSDAATFKTAMAGVKLRYELATPKVLTVDNPFPALIEVDNLGTEKRLPEDTADNPQGPFECDSNYSISTANLVRKLSE